LSAMKVTFWARDPAVVWASFGMLASVENVEGEGPETGVNVGIGMAVFNVEWSDDAPAAAELRARYEALKAKGDIIERPMS
jgi:hypothetical protein